MALPSSHTGCKTYFEDVLKFLNTYQWIYNYPNTHILVNKVFDMMPTSWISYLNSLSQSERDQNVFTQKNNDRNPESLRSLLTEIESLKPCYECLNNLPVTTSQKHVKMSTKKVHEIESLAPVIHSLCAKERVDVIVDVGTGVGYLPQLLCERHGYKILGLEGNERNVKLAIDRQNSLHPATKDKIKYVHHFVTSNSANYIKEQLDMNFPESKTVAIVGLHACADLSITVSKLFLEIDIARCLVIMPCCYHRLHVSYSKNECERFDSFPVSDALKEVYDAFDGQTFLRRYFLRLACQQTASKIWNMTCEKRDLLVQNCLFRAVLEMVAHEKNCSVSRTKRKTGPTAISSSEDDFQTYVENLKNTHTLSPKETAVDAASEVPLIDSPRFKMEMCKQWEVYKGRKPLVEFLLRLQASIQCICENLILLDRVVFLREKEIDCCVRRVTDDRISPRCYGLVATKVQTLENSDP